jgi:hypothetical protein
MDARSLAGEVIGVVGNSRAKSDEIDGILVERRDIPATAVCTDLHLDRSRRLVAEAAVMSNTF